MLPIVMVVSLRSALARNCPVGASAFSFAVLPEDEDRDMGEWFGGCFRDITESLHLLSDPWFDPEKTRGPLFLKNYCQI
jgi:hypothetical protein